MRLERTMRAWLAVVGITICVSALGWAAETKPPAPPAHTALNAAAIPHRAKPPAVPKSMEPSADHKLLENFVGRWTGAIHPMESMEFDQMRPAKDTTATVEGKPQYDGLFVEWTRTATIDDKPYEGRITFGFDDVTRRYTAISMDNTSPAFISYVGTYDSAKKRLNLEAHYSDQGTHRFMVSKLLIAFIDDGTIVVDEFMAHSANGTDVHTKSTTYKKS